MKLQTSFFTVLSLLALVFAESREHMDMHHRMDDLVDSVKEAVHEVDAAGQKREVVDLGQSLHLLEKKFTSLRSALAHELGAKATSMTSNSAVARNLVDRSTELVKGVVVQRDELQHLISDVKEVDSAIRSLKDGLSNFEKDVTELDRVIGDLHLSHNELTATHEEAKDRLHEVMRDAGQTSTNASSHSMFYLALLVEIAAFVGFLYLKRRGGTLAHKAYGKFG